MRKIVLIAVLALAALPAIAFAHGSSARSTAEKQCALEKHHMGSKTFKATFGKKNAFGKCVSHRTQQNSADEGQAQTSAEKQCKAEQSESVSTFMAANGGKTFAQKYGTNHNDKNAFGKCVSSKAKSKSESEENEQVNDENSAADQCRAEQKNHPDTFTREFGNKSDAFGKCVSKNSHEQESQQEEQQESSSS